MMNLEIERKFLVKGTAWREQAGTGVPIVQGYLACGPKTATVRVRLAGGQATLTIKGPAKGLARPEFEVPLPLEDAEAMIKGLCGSRVICKTRYCIHANGFCWEVDEFSGRHRGLVMAEVELERENQAVELPGWVGEEVSMDPRYTNAGLAESGVAALIGEP